MQVMPGKAAIQSFNHCCAKHVRPKHGLALGATTTGSTSGGQLRISGTHYSQTTMTKYQKTPQCCNVEKHFKFNFKYPSHLAKNGNPSISIAVCWVVAAAIE